MAFCIFRFFRLVVYPEFTSLLFSYIELFVCRYFDVARTACESRSRFLFANRQKFFA